MLIVWHVLVLLKKTGRFLRLRLWKYVIEMNFDFSKMYVHMYLLVKPVLF